MIAIRLLQSAKKPLFWDFQIVCTQTKRKQKFGAEDCRDKLINCFSGGVGAEKELSARGSERRGQQYKKYFRNGETRKKKGGE